MTRTSTRQIKELLRIYSERGLLLEDLPRLLGRKRETLRRYAKLEGIAFADYKPRKLK